MKVSKDALRHARALFQTCSKDGGLDIDRVRMIAKRIGEEKPRGYLGILTAFQRQIRLDLEKRHAVVESAEALSEDLKNGVFYWVGCVCVSAVIFGTEAYGRASTNSAKLFHNYPLVRTTDHNRI